MRAVEPQARELVHDKRVAIVGNSPEILDEDYGNVIDGHDVVFRMNKGVPALPEHYPAIGKRTDVLTGGVIGDLNSLAVVPPWIWWLKHTALGAHHLAEIRHAKHLQHVNVWHVPKELCQEYDAEVGSPASSALLLAGITVKFGARAVSVFGVSCWGQLEPGSVRHWWQYDPQHEYLGNTAWHNGKGEARWFKKHSRSVGRLWRQMHV